ncbi:MAG: SpaA isopeptide-forming pilin-related protein, partial [Propionicimonas sp.]|nr:SpaA isopeptide-forming pilin-related protein [Propionicimonas sp.]
MSGSRSERQSSRRKLNRKSVLGALLGLTLTVGMFPSSMAVADTPDPSDTASAAESSVSSSPELTETPNESTIGSSSSEGTTSSSAQESTVGSAVETQAAVGAGPAQAEIYLLGPDGASAPYVYWTVEDESDNPVAGAVFSLERRTTQWTGTRTVTDCETVGCTGVDRDSDQGEFLAKWIGSDNPGSAPGGTTITAGNRYRKQPVTAPAGYTWVSNTDWVDSNNRTWQGSGDSRTLDFGTFTVRKLEPGSYQPTCSAGDIYAISAAGQLQQVAPGSTKLLGTSAGRTYMNGLGIGSGGGLVYALQRSNDSGTEQNGTVWQFDTTTGQWSSTGASTSDLGGNTGTNLIGGAVDLSTGLYYFGGFTSNGNFKVYEYNPSANPRIKLKATVQTTATSSANGDIAFDAAGNFYIVHGSGNQSIVYSVTRDAFQGANGGTISSSATNSFNTSSDVNGVAFDSSGKGFLGSASTLRSYDQPNWSNGTNVASGFSSTDLASCSSPPTVVIEKEVVGGRVNDTDQFRLTLNQGGTLLGEATTTGSAVGIQSERIGPLPTVRNVELKFAESPSGTTNLAEYVSAYQCTVTYLDGTVQTLDEVTGTSGSVTIPTSGEAVRCVLRNSPLIASVSIHKEVTDEYGENPAPRKDWTVGATATATGTGTVTGVPAVATQQTNSEGDASWKFTFGGKNDNATINVLEQMQDGYEFLEGRCEVTKLTGARTTVDLTGPASTSLTDIAAGDKVDCTYTNKVTPQRSTLTLVKVVTNNFGGTAGVDDFGLTAKPGDGEVISFNSGEKKDVDPGTYLIGETLRPGYERVSLVCSAGDETRPVTDSKVDVATAQDVVCTLTNQDKPGSVTWSKVDEEGGLLAGAVWTLAGPDQGTEVDIEDCVAASATSCTGLDKDPAVGQFKVEDLAWGSYILTEKTAPPGYQRTGENFEFTITGDALEISLDEIANEQQTGVILP